MPLSFAASSTVSTAPSIIAARSTSCSSTDSFPDAMREMSKRSSIMRAELGHAFEGCQRSITRLTFDPGIAQHPYPRQNGVKGSTQVVRQDRKELVLPTVGLA